MGDTTRLAADFGDGLAQGPDLAEAAETAVAAATAPLHGRRPDLMTVFVTHPDPDVAGAAARRAMEIAGATTVIGCRASGVIGDGRGVEVAPAIAVWAASLPGVRATPFRLQAARHESGISVTGMPVNSASSSRLITASDALTWAATDASNSANAARALVRCSTAVAIASAASARRLMRSRSASSTR